MTLPSVYNPTEVERRWYGEWEQKGFFKPAVRPEPFDKAQGRLVEGRQSAQGRPFTIVIPPPNVTGILHMGHALNNTLQDILIRFKRMQGFAALWVPGTDHAGIATQNVVERELLKEGITRQQLGREKFVERVWQWREKYGFRIIQQLRRLGASCDWSRERFTMDEGLSRAVQEAFLQLHREGLIYRGYYLVNWCPRCQTALSDEEVQHEQVQSHLYYIRYPLKTPNPEPRTPNFIVVATTRPETLLGDVAVAVHPEDERYRKLSNETILLPILNRPLKMIQDTSVDREFGTGAVKVTPAHDPTDFQLGQKYHLQAIRVMHSDGRMNDQAGPYAGMDRFECRKRILEDLASSDLLEKTEEYTTSIGHCYRCKTIIEPTLSPQWFVKMAPLAKLGVEAVEKDGMRFIPERWTKVYLDWLRNIRDWCISRQIWWGHRIPAWYCKGCYPAYVEAQERGTLSGTLGLEEEKAGIHVGPERPAKCRRCGGSDLVQDEDVLDTWFSSWLWPFSTLGWPQQTKDLNTFYPTSVLVTGQDIIFFWVARMVMAGKFFLKQIPFKDVYIHGIIRVEGGKKMSKSLGNIIDPLAVIDRMGADALRFSLAHMTSEGQDLYLSEEKFLLGRNFANKLWNASRLIFEKRDSAPQGPISFNPRSLTIPDRWILSRFQRVVEEVTEDLGFYRFNAATRALYQFVWHEFCDWYLEIAKLQWDDPDPQVVQATHWVLASVLEGVVRLLHPFVPFITEELWQKIHNETIMKTSWPEPNRAWLDPEGEALFDSIQGLIAEVRNIRSTFRVPVKEKVSLLIQGECGAELVRQHEKIIQRLGLADRISIEKKVGRPAGSVVSHLSQTGDVGPWDLIVPLSGLVDLAVERRRIEGELSGLQERAEGKRKRLQDSTFRAKAPPEVIQEEEQGLKDLEAEILRWSQSLGQLR